MLVVMKNRYVACPFKPLLYFEASRSRYVLKVNPAKAARKQCDRFDYIIDIFRPYAKRNGIYAAKRLKKDALSFHNGHSGFGAYITKAEHGRSVRDNGYCVAPARQFVAEVNILVNFYTRLSNARRIRQRQIFPALNGHFVYYIEFSLPFIMQAQRFACIIHKVLPPVKLCRFIDII